MEVIPLECGPLATNCYILIDEFTKTALLIDCPPDSCDAILELSYEKDFKIEALLLTHSHFDHIMDASELKEVAGIPVYVHKDDEYRLLDPMKHASIALPFEVDPVTPDGYLKHGDTILCGDMIVEVIHTPGHTEGSVSFTIHNKKLCFTGDTIFRGSVGRIDLPGGNEQQILNSINNKILALADDYILFPGHGPRTTVGYEKATNPFLSGLLL